MADSEADDPELPIEGTTELDLPVDRLWAAFREAEGWPAWNPCFAWVWVPGGELREGAQLVWTFNPIRRRYLYRMPATAKVVECRPGERVTWEVRLPGFHARHTYHFEAVGPDRSRLGSWEVAEGPSYRAMRRFWLAHFRYVCRESLAGGLALARRGVGVRLRSFGTPTDLPTLLAIPGLDGSPGAIAPIVARLAARRRVVVADYAQERNRTLEELAEEIAAAARDRLDGEVDLLGQSIGTLAAAEIVTRRALPVRRTVLIGTFTRVRDRAVRVATTASTFTPRALQELTTPPLMALVCGPVGDGRRHPFFAAVRASDPASGRKRTRWQAGRDFAPLLERVDGPLLVLLGERDRFPPRGDQDRVRAAVAGRGRVVGIPGAGHVLLPSAAIARAADEIEGFLA
jgi:pimeloyl-ACP methyl ester carboxylesterase